MKREDFNHKFSDFIGSRVVQIFRVFFVFRESMDESVGPIQIDTDKGSILIRADKNGSLLNAVFDSWEHQNRDYISAIQNGEFNEIGYTKLVSVSSKNEYQKFIGKEINSLEPILNCHEDVIGAKIKFSGEQLNVLIDADECYVNTGNNLPFHES